MLKTVLDIAMELKNPGKITHRTLEYCPEELSVYGRQLVTDGNIKINISYSYDGEGGVNMEGKISAMFHEECSRCGVPFLVPFECEFSEFFIRSRNGDDIDADDTDSYTFTGDTLDLTDLIEETVLLNYPMTSLCREDCRGLCPECGCNLNEMQCDCGEDTEELDIDSEDAFEKAMERLRAKYQTK